MEFLSLIIEEESFYRWIIGGMAVAIIGLCGFIVKQWVKINDLQEKRVEMMVKWNDKLQEVIRELEEA